MTDSQTSEEVRPGQLVTDFAMAPYPGKRPAGSWVIDPDGRLFPVHADAEAASGWSVTTDRARAQCVDDWLRQHGGEPMSGRIPVLSYGSNANPQKVVRNSVSLPTVSMACVVEELAAVWCHDTRDVARVPATLVPWKGSREQHALSYVVPPDFGPLDEVEGRGVDRYRLVRLTEGRVLRADGVALDVVYSYVGGRADRLPLVDEELRPVRLVDLDHAGARRAGHDGRHGSGELPDLGPVITGRPTPGGTGA